MIFSSPPPILLPPVGPEAAAVAELRAAIPLDEASRIGISTAATALVEEARRGPHPSGIDGMLAEYRLSTQEGVVLMCLAEALLRIPDQATIDRLIKDKLGSAHWEEHLGRSSSTFVNASTWGLMLGERLLRVEDNSPTGAIRALVARLGEAVVRRALRAAMSVLGHQFVMGRDITEALDHGRHWRNKGYGLSFDMLGEAARTSGAAETYHQAYAAAIAALGAEGAPASVLAVSVKLSALHPRYEQAHRQSVLDQLTPRLLDLCRSAKAFNIGVTVDAEEADRLCLSLELFAAMAGDPSLAGWNGLGLAVQAYQLRARPAIAWLAGLARRTSRRLPVRLVKGAYWDSEIKRAQERGLDGFPVFTSKPATDLSYLACAADLLSAPDCFSPQFATHNAHTIAAIAALALGRSDWEFQRLHGMGEPLYRQLVPATPCRIYAPVGSHAQLLPYLVRRLLENGANTSFVNRLADTALPAPQVVIDPFTAEAPSRPKVAPARDLFAPERINSSGLDLGDPAALVELNHALAQVRPGSWSSAPIIDGRECPATPPRPRHDPACHDHPIGEAVDATPQQISQAVQAAETAFTAWNLRGGPERAALLEQAADLFEQDRHRLMALLIAEAGKTIPDALSELRESVDFLRFYAAATRRDFATRRRLPGPVGERNDWSLGGRGVFACISPWNFPLAIFTGQIAAALAAGNTVVAKPAEQTPLIAAAAVRLLHRAGIPSAVLHLIPGDGAIGQALVEAEAIGGVAFTGSLATARAINATLAHRDGPILPLIAETGGVNALIADSSALPEQLVGDVLESAFRSAGQRCSALRVLFLQAEAWDTVVPLLCGAMNELSVGDPGRLSTDVGPVIDDEALATLRKHAERLGPPLARTPLGPECGRGTFFAPCLYEVDGLDALPAEIFGPILHLVRWEASDLDEVIASVNGSGHGLTLGIHSRIDATIDTIATRARVGNVYVNRSMIGAVVGSQPFGGLGLSGTGPKAGGPLTLHRFACEHSLSVNTAAMGGDAALLAGED